VTPTGTKVSRGRMNRSERRTQLLKTARDLIQSEGLSMVTMERVADRAGISKPVLYSHFENREDLLIALLQEFWESIDARVSERAASDNALDDQIHSILESYFDLLESSGLALQELMLPGSGEPRLEDVRRERFSSIEKIWSHTYERALGFDKSEALIAATIVRNAVIGTGQYWMANRPVDRDQCIKVCYAMVQGGLHALADRPKKRTTRR
jgi:AcrR family transcriptional regulator